ncbi:MAG: type II toxin-antitoxin system Phd/YefM family antitoxin [Schaalia sp.]
METIPLTDARADLVSAVNRAQKEAVLLSRRGKPVAVLISPDAYEHTVDALEVAEDDAAQTRPWPRRGRVSPGARSRPASGSPDRRPRTSAPSPRSRARRSAKPVGTGSREKRREAASSSRQGLPPMPAHLIPLRCGVLNDWR